jgi:hypothetical protein
MMQVEEVGLESHQLPSFQGVKCCPSSENDARYAAPDTADRPIGSGFL